MNPTRRSFVTVAAAVPFVAACSAFTTTTTNGKTTVSVDVSKIDAWGQAFSNAGLLILGLPGVSALPIGAAITAGIALVKADLAAFDTAAGGNVTLTFDTSSVPAFVQSVLADGKTLLADVSGVPGALSSTVQTEANEYVQALATIVSVFSATIGSMVAAAAPGGMSEGTALATLRVKS